MAREAPDSIAVRTRGNRISLIIIP